MRKVNLNKQYLVFAGHRYYPFGGWNDFQKSFVAFYDAERFAKSIAHQHDWVQCIHLESEKPMFSIHECKEVNKNEPV